MLLFWIYRLFFLNSVGVYLWIYILSYFTLYFYHSLSIQQVFIGWLMNTKWTRIHPHLAQMSSDSVDSIRMYRSPLTMFCAQSMVQTLRGCINKYTWKVNNSWQNGMYAFSKALIRFICSFTHSSNYWFHVYQLRCPLCFFPIEEFLIVHLMTSNSCTGLFPLMFLFFLSWCYEWSKKP